MTATSAPEAEARRSLVQPSDLSTDHHTGATHDGNDATLRSPSRDSSALPTSSTTIKTEDGLADDVSPEMEEHSTPTTLRPAPQPSTKLRESEAALVSPDPVEKHGKKRKRAVSPPWQFPTAEVATLKTADGRRISARVNTNTPGLSESDDRPSSANQSVTRSRPASPPWRKFGADGPTSIHVDGRRKSGRVNKELTETPKRVSPRSKKQVDKVLTKTNGETRLGPTRGRAESLRKSSVDIKKSSHMVEHSSPSGSKGEPDEKMSRIADLQRRIAALQPSHSSDYAAGDGKRGHKRKPSEQSTRAHHDSFTSPPRSRRTRRPSNASLSPEASRPSPKIKLRLNAVRHTIPHPHPQASMLSPTRPPRLSLHQIIENFELQEMQQPYAETDRAPPEQEFFLQRATKQATEEGAMRRRLVKETERGGVLSKEILSLFKDDRQPEPPQQYGHGDHLVAHALYLRQLQQREKAHHRMLAKKLAHEAVEYWKAINGPTEEDLFAEQTKILELVKKQVVVDMEAKWRMVEAHVRDAKRQKWEAEQEVIRAEKLQQKLQWSENLLAKQRGEADSDFDMDEDSAGDVRDSDEDDEDEREENRDVEDEGRESLEENMSESDSESDESHSGDEGEMDEEALAAYLAHRDVEASTDSDQQDDTLADDESATNLAGVDVRDDEIDDGMKLTPNGYTADLAADICGSKPQTIVDGESTRHNAGLDTSKQARRPARGRRGSSLISQTQEENEAERHLSSDESTDMDSEDYDSDEDMSSTDADEHDNEDSDDASDESDDKQVSQARHSLLAFYNSKDFAREKDGGLPTPVTSVENGGDNENVRSASEAQSDEEHVSRSTVEAFSTAKIEATMKTENNLELVDGINEELHHGSGVLPDSNHLEATSPVKSTLETDHVVTNADLQPLNDEVAIKSLVPSPSLLRGKLRSYQHAGLDWLASLYRNGTNGILADEMGLGKTIQTISLLAHLAEVHEVWDTHLVIVPTSVILNWVTEFQKFLPGFRVLGYYGTAEERQNKRRGWVNDPHHENKDKRGYNIVVTSYNVAMQDINAIRNVQWHYLILDEAHNIRNFNSQRWQVLVRLRTRARLLLTGTPLQNNLAEVWALLTFLTAGDDDRSHGELEEFLGHWKDPVKEIFDNGVQTLSTQAQKVIDQLHISLRPFLLRRKKSEVEKDLPKKTESVVVCKLSKRQRQLYQEYMGLAETRATLAKGSGVQAGAVLLSLRRVCNHPDLFDPRPIQTSFAMEKSAIEGSSVKERMIRRLLGPNVHVPDKFLVVANEGKHRSMMHRSRKLGASALLQKQIDSIEAEMVDQHPDTSTLRGTRAFQRLQQRQRKLNNLRACIQITDRALRDTPVYGTDLRDLVTVHKPRPYSFSTRRTPIYRSVHGWPALGNRPLRLEHPGDWFSIQASRLQQDIMTLEGYAEKLQDVIVRFAFVPPAVTAPVLDFAIPRSIQGVIRNSTVYPGKADYAHEARTRTSIAFPDSRLLIYDSGKLQRLTYLLRELQSKGSRSLIFTQMTGTLNVLERFLSLLNLPYLRLDGSTPVERRQLYSAEFNRPDSKYQCMILSSRAGGVGLNLTGASSVIFYDLDWNPQMDRQCMDRAHRIGQVRDVEVYKMVSEKTVEENILRRANQKSLLDQTVIQEGHFTTEHPTRRQDVVQDIDEKVNDEDEVAAAIERFLGGGEKSTTQALESVEDKEDVHAAQQARKEDHQDDVDFADRSSKGPSKANTPAPLGGDVHEDEEDEERKGHIDLYMIKYMEHILKDQPYVPPPVRKLDKNGRDPSHRPKRRR